MMSAKSWKTVWIVGLVLGLALKGIAQDRPSQAPKRPNIVFIITDSHRSEALGIRGNPFVQTPNLDRLARQGILFKNAYVTTAICAVSRASILSGQHRARHQINDFTTGFSGPALENTYPMVLKKAGYKTAQIGFLGVGKKPPTELFDHWEGSIPWMTEDGLHQTDHVTRKAVDFLEKHQSGGPFYLALSFNAAHEIDGVNGKPATYLVQERYKDLYKDVTIPVPTTAAPEYWNHFPDFFRTDQNIGRARWHGLFSTPELFQQNTKNYYRLITGLDESVGVIVAKLKELKLDENTIVVYTSDHGFSLGEHGLMGKWYGFEASTHVPLIINDLRPSSKWHSVQPEQLVLNIDLAPTLLGFAGVRAPEGMQGTNLMDLLAGKAAERKHFFYEHTVFTSPALPKVEGIISKDFKYFRYTEHEYESLYDCRRDPEETRDVARDPGYKKQLARMRSLYLTEKSAID
ncbi:arylsulfatase A-like enzyme [Larkinella arboricola]|uniref:Arylsulfatase A-like enzyme n=1 Tax=Larkinella arboricola TaxID=643671 RepID=A0A327WJP7_LARAB|nr:sulfatase [Larkinella arboricola]RAJ91033.1 arylsulfatase A-like enzyme [Larkinella arboricola]